MAEFTRNSKQNCLEIFKGFHRSKFKGDYEYIPLQESDMEIIKNKKGVIGIKFNNFYEKLEIASYYSENDMKKLLEKSKYNSLFLGRNMEISETDSDFYLNIGNSRPDFLVYIPEIGNIFMDVKCRKKFTCELSAGGETYQTVEYFALAREEMEILEDLQKNLHMPVWLAIRDYQQFDLEKREFVEKEFYFVPITVVQDYMARINRLSKKYAHLYYSYKIPVSMLTFSENLNTFEIRKNIDGKLIAMMADYTIKGVEEIHQVITEMVSRENVYKTHLSYILCGNDQTKSEFSGRLENFLPQDVNAILWSMIEKGELLFEKNKPLKINPKYQKDKKE